MPFLRWASEETAEDLKNSMKLNLRIFSHLGRELGIFSEDEGSQADFPLQRGRMVMGAGGEGDPNARGGEGGMATHSR